MNEIFVAGCIGAAAPEIIRSYELRNQRRKIRFSPYYVIVSIAYIGLGGYVASVFPGSDSSFIGLTVGCGLVCVVNTLAKAAGRLARHALGIIGGIGKWGGKGGMASPGEFSEGPRRGTIIDFVELI